MDRSSAGAVLAQLPNAFTHFNKVHPHSASKPKSPRMFKRELARQARENASRFDEFTEQGEESPVIDALADLL